MAAPACSVAAATLLHVLALAAWSSAPPAADLAAAPAPLWLPVRLLAPDGPGRPPDPPAPGTDELQRRAATEPVRVPVRPTSGAPGVHAHAADAAVPARAVPDQLPGAAVAGAAQSAAHTAEGMPASAAAGTAPDTAPDKSPDAAADAEGPPANADDIARLPRYAASPLPPFVATVSGQRNGQPVSGLWRVEPADAGRPAEGYRTVLELQAGGEPWLRQHSHGALRSHGLQPEGFEDLRRGRRSVLALDPPGGEARVGSRGTPVPVSPQVQDRLSALLQLAAVLRAEPGRTREGARTGLPVLGARGVSQLWWFESHGVVPLQRPDGTAMPALLAVREPQAPYDNRVELWLDLQQGHRPVRLRLTQLPAGQRVDLWFDAVPSPTASAAATAPAARGPAAAAP